jgi:UDP-glucose 4-epimerase
VADSSKLQRTLKWTPKHSQLREIVSTAWQFERRRRVQQIS